MSFTAPPDCRRGSAKSIDTTGTLLYNVKVNQGKERSKFPACIYFTNLIMKDKLSPRERFVSDISHAYAKYGITISNHKDPKQVYDLFRQMQDALEDNFKDISTEIYKLENLYPKS